MTFRKIAEEIQKHSEDHLRAVVETTPECVKLVAADGTLIQMNRSGLDMIGADSEDQVRGTLVFNLIDPAFRDQWIINHNRVCSGEAVAWEFEIVGLSGAKKFLETNAVPFKLNNGRFVHLSVTRDVSHRKKMESELRQTAEQLKIIFQTVHDGILVQDTNFRCVYANDAGAKMCGFNSADELINTSIEDLKNKFVICHEDGTELPFSDLPARKVFRGAELAEAALLVKPAATGLEYWSSVACRPVKDANGNISFAVSVFRDITRQKQTELEAKLLSEISSVFAESTDQKRTLEILSNAIVPRLADWFVIEILGEDNTLVPYHVMHRDPEFVKLATEMRRKFPSRTDDDTPSGEALKTGRPFFTPDISDQVIDALPHEELRSMVRKLKPRSAIVIPLQSRSKMVGVLHLAYSESAPKLSEQNLDFLLQIGTRIGLALDNAFLYEQTKRSEERLELALSNSQIGLWEWQIEDDELYFSDRCLEIFGSEKIENFHTEFQAIMHPEDRDRVSKALAVAIETGGDYSVEYRIHRQDNGALVWVQAKGRCHSNAEGKPVRMIGTVVDITARIQRENDYRIAKVQADKANQTKSIFLANMSHEIRTPMNAILGFTTLLTDPDLQDHEREDFSRRVQANGNQLLHLIDDILDLSKVEAGELKLETSDLSLSTLALDLHESVSVLVKGKNVRARLELDQSLPKVIKSDEVRLKQVINNLLSNAVKFTDEGFIDLRFKAGADHKLVIEVEDSGIGIAKEAHLTLFKLFSQADSSVTRKYGGTGLGLQLSRKICEALGGTLALVRSARGEGAVFRITLPLIAATSARADRAGLNDSTLEAMPAGLRVLLVEDSPDNQALIKTYLKNYDLKLSVASDGEQAVKLATTQEFDLILMDIQMPVMDGLEATRIIRASNINIPVLALTAHALPEEVERSFEAGCNAHLTKPVSKLDLVRELKRFSPTPGQLLLQ